MPYLSEFNLFYFEKSHVSADAPVLILIHGFTGSHEIFNHLINDLNQHYHLIIPDLPGHGQSKLPEKETLDLKYLLKIIHKLVELYPKKEIFLYGYSLGGRIALQFAVKSSYKLSGLILESTTFGILDNQTRKERIESDIRIAQTIEENFSLFLNDWETLPVFKTEKCINPSLLLSLEQIRLKQNPSGLSAMLRGFGTGIMEVCFDGLPNISCKVLILTGEEDKKFTSVGKLMNNQIKNSQHIIVPQCGHRIHLEDSDAYLGIINTFILNNLRTV